MSGPLLAVDFGPSTTIAVLRWPDGRLQPVLVEGIGPDGPEAALRRIWAEVTRAAGAAPDGSAPVTITHPVTWLPEHLDALRAAAHAAGLPAPVLLPRPVAAAAHFTHVLRHPVAPGGGIVVCDADGATAS